jgi:hypothetical protein
MQTHSRHCDYHRPVMVRRSDGPARKKFLGRPNATSPKNFCARIAICNFTMYILFARCTGHRALSICFQALTLENTGRIMSLKERLLAALDTSLDEVSEEILVDVLLEQLKQAKATVFEAQQALIREGLRADSFQKEMKEREHRMCIDPTYAAHGDFYFASTTITGAPLYVVSIGDAHNIRMFRREGGIDYTMMQISPEYYQSLIAGT